MLRLGFLILFFLAIAAVVGFATVIRIPEEYPTIQEGIDAAQEGDTVLVGPGTYYENVAFRGANIYLKSEAGPEVTIIDGGGKSPAISVRSFNDTTTVIDGFTITHGRRYDGGGIYIWESHPKVVNNWILQNHVGQYGGGISVDYGGVIARYNIIAYNSCPKDRGGAAIHTQYAKVDISKNLIVHNSGPSVVFLRHTTLGFFINNTLANGWSGISAHDGSRIFTKNNIVAGFIDYGLAGDLYNSYNCTYDNVTDYKGCAAGEGAVFSDPLFVGGYPYDHHLLAGSPCIDAGDPKSPRDPDSTRADIGVFYFHQNIVGITITPDTTIVKQGDCLGYTVELYNATEEDKTFSYWSDLYLWDGTPYKKNPVFGPRLGTLKTGEFISDHIGHLVPTWAPIKTYTLYGRIGNYPGDIWGEDSFEFEVWESPDRGWR